jgi:hypothetical protein
MTSNTHNNTEASAVQDARENVVEDCRKALKAFYANEAQEKFAQLRGEIFSSNATHFFLKDILNKCELKDTVDNIKNLEVALRLMKLKLKAEDAS